MQLLIYGPGRLGHAVAAAAGEAGWPEPFLVGRAPLAGARDPAPVADVVVDASSGSAVAANVAHAIAGGNRCFVLAATGWDADVPRVQALLAEHGATAVAAPNLSVGAALFVRLAAVAAGWYAGAGTSEPSIVEWHRRGKGDRPSGTARALARRIAGADARWADPDDDLDPRPRLEIAAIRAGASPGTHVVSFDGPGEAIELRLGARDRSAYAAGALAAARWLSRGPRTPGLHHFDDVVDDLLAAPSADSASIPVLA